MPDAQTAAAFGAIIGTVFVVIYSAVMVVNKYLGNKTKPEPQMPQQVVAACPLNAEPQLRAMVAKGVDGNTALIGMVKQVIDHETAAENRSMEILKEIVALMREFDRRVIEDHTRHESNLEEARRAIDAIRNAS